MTEGSAVTKASLQILKSSRHIKTYFDAVSLMLDNICDGVVIINKDFDEIFKEQKLNTEGDTDNYITIPKHFGDLIANIQITGDEPGPDPGRTYTSYALKQLKENLISRISLVNKETGETIFSSTEILRENGITTAKFIAHTLPIRNMPEMQLCISSKLNKKYKVCADFIVLETHIRRKLEKGVLIKNDGLYDPCFIHTKRKEEDNYFIEDIVIEEVYDFDDTQYTELIDGIYIRKESEETKETKETKDEEETIIVLS